MSLVTSLDTADVLLPPATVVAIWLDVPLARKADIPEFIEHQVEIDPVSSVPNRIRSFPSAGEIHYC